MYYIHRRRLSIAFYVIFVVITAAYVLQTFFNFHGFGEKKYTLDYFERENETCVVRVADNKALVIGKGEKDVGVLRLMFSENGEEYFSVDVKNVASGAEFDRLKIAAYLNLATMTYVFVANKEVVEVSDDGVSSAWQSVDAFGEYKVSYKCIEGSLPDALLTTEDGEASYSSLNNLGKSMNVFSHVMDLVIIDLFFFALFLLIRSFIAGNQIKHAYTLHVSEYDIKFRTKTGRILQAALSLTAFLLFLFLVYPLFNGIPRTLAVAGLVGSACFFADAISTFFVCFTKIYVRSDGIVCCIFGKKVTEFLKDEDISVAYEYEPMFGGITKYIVVTDGAEAKEQYEVMHRRLRIDEAYFPKYTKKGKHFAALFDAETAAALTNIYKKRVYGALDETEEIELKKRIAGRK